MPASTLKYRRLAVSWCAVGLVDKTRSLEVLKSRGVPSAWPTSLEVSWCAVGLADKPRSLEVSKTRSLEVSWCAVGLADKSRSLEVLKTRRHGRLITPYP